MKRPTRPPSTPSLPTLAGTPPAAVVATLVATLLALVLAACASPPAAPPDPAPGGVALTPDASSVLVERDASGSLGVTLDPDATLEIGPLPAGVTAEVGTGDAADARVVIFRAAADAELGVAPVTLTGRTGAAEVEVSVELLVEEAGSGAPVHGHAPGVTGEVRTVTIGGQEIAYEVIDGLAIFQGDMILGEVEQVEALLAAAQESGSLGTSATACTVDLIFMCGRWSNGVVPYSIKNDWGVNNAEMNRRIGAAMAMWEADTNIRFVRQAGGERVEFRNNGGGGCSADVGRSVRIFEAQGVNIAPVCSVGTIAHEIGHAIGLFHEHARNDRDDHVRVQMANVRDGRGHDFWKAAVIGADVGPYDFDSIMHYPAWGQARNPVACRRGDASACTILPRDPGVPPARLGQRSTLSDGDILGAYWMYPPSYVVEGASDGERGDTFFLFVDVNGARIRGEYLRWSSDRDGVLGTGASIRLRAGELTRGAHRIRASLVLNGVTVTSAELGLELVNDPPEVALVGAAEADLNGAYTVRAVVNDSEDGSCSATVCDYLWSPEPTEGPNGGPTASYRFGSEGPRTISVTVTDKAGASRSASLSVDVVNRPPLAEITDPAGSGPIARATGATLRLTGTASDVNETPVTLPCSALSWSSSDPSDRFAPATGCSTEVTLGDPGPRTLTLTARDPQGLAGTATRSVSVTACDGNCRPSVDFSIVTPQDFHSTVFGTPGYFETTTIAMTARIDDPDVPKDVPVSYRWTAVPPCFGSCVEVIAEGTLTSLPATLDIDWRPDTDFDLDCTTEIPLELILTVTDARGLAGSYRTSISISCELI